MTLTTKRSQGYSEPGEAAFLPSYARLRTVLDGLEINALRYCLNARDVERRIALAAEIVEALMPLVKRFTLRPPDGEGCPEGYVDCNGVCVPYQCVGSGDTK